ncbi:MAG: endolytic transglycosylase MltG [Peptococcaceae bacterium]|jgi:UPF0755 protein|nr:endolytic transglycosylase MltG [Peptococcaceae bacterium]
MGRKIKGFFFVILLVFFAAAIWWSESLRPYAAAEEEAEVEVLTIYPGMQVSQIAEELESRNLIRSARVFRYLAKLRNVDALLRSGDYSVSQALTPQQVIDKLLQEPEMGTVRVTIPEGFTTEQIANTLTQKELGSKATFYQAIAEEEFSYTFLAGAPAGEKRLDGFLFPDTYFWTENAAPREILDKFLQRFQLELTAEAQARLQSLNLSVREWVTLASLVEKEAQMPEDRPVIAAVFMNRLDKKMKLESCATIQYVLGTPKAKLYEKDLQIPSPYNTYLHEGLPPGPIASPGHAALEAVLYPADTEFLFFLAKGDGYHVFAKTFAEHLQNQRTYGDS